MITETEEKDFKSWARMRVALRKLSEKDPAAFARVRWELLVAGEHWERVLPPFEKKGRRRVKVPRAVLAVLLASYKVRPSIKRGKREKREPRDQFFAPDRGGPRPLFWHVSFLPLG
jgi:hypothetical protein